MWRFKGTRMALTQHFKTASFEEVGLYVQKFLKNVVDDKLGPLNLGARLDLWPKQLRTFLENSALRDENILLYNCQYGGLTFTTDRDSSALMPTVFKTWLSDRFGDSSAGFNNRLSSSLSPQLDKFFSPANENQVLGLQLSYTYQSNEEPQRISLGVFDTRQLGLLMGDVSPYKSEVVALVPDYRLSPNKGAKTLSDLLDLMHENEVLRNSANPL